MDYISREALYEKTAEWEAQALQMVEKTMNDEDTTEWRKWSTILKERSAFKFDVADAPAADVVERKRGKWHDIYCMGKHEVDLMICSNCHYRTLISGVSWPNFCPNCGAKME